MVCRGSSSWTLGSQIWEGDMSQLAGHLCSHNVPIFVSWSWASTIFCIIFPRWITFFPPPWLSTWQRPGINCIAEKGMCPVFPAGESSIVSCLHIYIYIHYIHSKFREGPLFGCVIQPAIPNLVIEYHIVHYRHYIHETQCLNLVLICLDDDLDHKLLGFRV